MGEYAKRKTDGTEIKIGTCEQMYYLRYENRHDVEKLPNSLDPSTETGLFWRLPFPDEDYILPGEYEEHSRGVRLFRVDPETKRAVDFPADEFKDAKPGTIQLHHRGGLLLNVPCHHGARLPDVPEGWRAFWNGKTHAFELCAVKNTEKGVFPIVRCAHCGSMWSFDNWEDILPFIHDKELQARCELYECKSL